MVDDEKLRTALKQEADTVELPDRVWAKVQTARPDRPGLFSRLHIKRAAEVLAVCAVLAAVVGVANLRANHGPKDPANQVINTTLPDQLTMKEIKTGTVKLGPSKAQMANLSDPYLAKIVDGYNDQRKSVRPRTEPATADYTIDLALTSGKVLLLGVLKGQPIMADYDGAQFWIESMRLTSVLESAPDLVNAPPAQGPFLAPDKLANITSVEWRGPAGTQKKTTTDPALIAGFTDALGKVTSAVVPSFAGGTNGETGAITLHPSSGENILVEYFCTSYDCYARGSFDISGWHKASDIGTAIKPLRPGPAITSEVVADMARHAVDPTIEWWVRQEPKGSLNSSSDLVFVAVGINSQNQRVAIYVDPVSGNILKTDAPEGMDKAEAAVTQFYSLTSRGEYKSVWDLLHQSARHPNHSLTPEVIQARLAAKQGKPGPSLVSATAGKMGLDYSKYSTCMCMISDSVQVTAKLSDGTEQRIMVAREADGVWRILWDPEG